MTSTAQDSHLLGRAVIIYRCVPTGSLELEAVVEARLKLLVLTGMVASLLLLHCRCGEAEQQQQQQQCTRAKAFRLHLFSGLHAAGLGKALARRGHREKRAMTTQAGNC